MQEKAETQESSGAKEKPATERQQDAVLEKEQEPKGSQPLVQEQVITPEKRVRFKANLLASDWKQWLPIKRKTEGHDRENAGKSLVSKDESEKRDYREAEVEKASTILVREDVKDNHLKRSNKELRKPEKYSKKAARVKTEWQRVRVNESSTSCCSSTESSADDEQVLRPAEFHNEKVSIKKDDNLSIKSKGKSTKWMSQPTATASASEASSAEGSESEGERESISILKYAGE